MRINFSTWHDSMKASSVTFIRWLVYVNKTTEGALKTQEADVSYEEAFFITFNIGIFSRGKKWNILKASLHKQIILSSITSNCTSHSWKLKTLSKISRWIGEERKHFEDNLEISKKASLSILYHVSQLSVSLWQHLALQ